MTVLPQASPPKVDIIWNTTLVCPYDCKKCCVGAIHAKTRNGEVLLSSSDLSTYIAIQPTEPRSGANRRWLFDQGARHRQQQGLELDLDGKLRVLDHLDGVAPKIDISGGDPLVLSETMTLIRAAAERFGKKSITLTATGVGLGLVTADELAPHVGEVNITFDGTPPPVDPLCPNGYALANLREAIKLAEHGIPVRAEIPLTRQNIDPSELERIYRALADTPIEKLLVMRLFPVGRGELRERDIPSRVEYAQALNVLRKLEARFGRPKLKLQCALRHIDGATTGLNPCDAVRKSFGLMANGTLLGSPWAINAQGQPIDPAWVLGNLATTPMTEILATEKVRYLQEHADDNFGHCKIFASLYGESADTLTRISERADPLYFHGLTARRTE